MPSDLPIAGHGGSALQQVHAPQHGTFPAPKADGIFGAGGVRRHRTCSIHSTEAKKFENNGDIGPMLHGGPLLSGIPGCNKEHLFLLYTAGSPKKRGKQHNSDGNFCADSTRNKGLAWSRVAFPARGYGQSAVILIVSLRETLAAKQNGAERINCVVPIWAVGSAISEKICDSAVPQAGRTTT